MNLKKYNYNFTVFIQLTMHFLYINDKYFYELGDILDTRDIPGCIPNLLNI